MDCITDVATLRAATREWRAQGQRIAFVPTMGNLHAGHFSLVERARAQADRVVASVFVNPTQFGPNEDLARYPRTPEQDAAGLRAHGCDVLFLPDVATMYPLGVAQATHVEVPGLSDILCGAFRPGHFAGVATVVLRLFNLVQPDVAVFGSKDYQQLQVIRHMVADLALSIAIDGAPIVREPDGLALSSRNQYLDPAQRAQAARIHAVLQAMRAQRAAGGSLERIEADARAALEAAGFVVDYAELRRADLSRPDHAAEPELVALVAARLGSTRLIDNLVLA